MTKLSIIIPIYNAEPFLKRCLNSLIIPEEYIHDVEVIAIDDGSTDASAGILDEERDRVGFKIIHHSTNWGVGMTRNHGISIASGEWVTFLDADDELHPNAIAFMLGTINKEQKDPLIAFNHLRVYGDGKPVAKFVNKAGCYTLGKTMPQKWTPVWGKMVRRDFINDNGIRFPQSLSYGEDEIFLLQCLRICKHIGHENEATILKHYDNPESLTHTLTKKKLDEFMRCEMDLLLEDNPKGFDDAVRELIAHHWIDNTYRGVYGG